VAVRHPTEEEIQTYLDGFSGEASAEIRHHLETCEQCGRMFAEYRALYAGLGDGSTFEVPRDLAGSVLSKLGLMQTGCRFRIPGDVVLVACSIVAMLIGVSVFADIGAMVSAVSAAVRPILAYVLPYLGSAQDLLTDTGSVPAIFMTGILILVLAGLVDSAFKLRRLSDIINQTH
jgi:hypothetical protein